MPPWPAPVAANFSSPLMSATNASVVSINAAIDAAFCNARWVTLAGSITPALSISPYLPVSALKPQFSSFESRTHRTNHSAFVAGVKCNLTYGLFEGALYDVEFDGFAVI